MDGEDGVGGKAGCRVLTGLVVSVWVATASAAVQLVSVGDEIAIGKQSQAQMRKDTPEVADAIVRAYVTKVGIRLGAQAAGDKYPYTFSIANYKEINALALPGGPVWVNRGAMQMARTESQLAGILAHEVAHISQRHAAQQLSTMMVATFGLGVFSALLGNTGAATAASVAARSVAGGAFLKFSRDDEEEADRVGAGIMMRAGWNPRGMIEMLDAVRTQEKRDPTSVEAFFSNHPASKDRIALLERIVPAKSTGKRDSAEFQSIRARLTRLPPAASMTKKK